MSGNFESTSLSVAAVQATALSPRRNNNMYRRVVAGVTAPIAAMAVAACTPETNPAANCVAGYRGGVCASSTRTPEAAAATSSDTSGDTSTAAPSTDETTASATPTPTPTTAAPETTATATPTPTPTATPSQTTAAAPQPGNFIPTQVDFSRLSSPNACQQGGSSGQNLVPLVTPECDGQSLLTNESAGPKVGEMVTKVCYIQAGDNGTDNVWAVIKTSPDWANPDNSGQAANGGFIGVVPAGALLDQNAMAPCPSGYDTSGFPSVSQP